MTDATCTALSLTISHTDGTEETHKDLAAVWASLRARYGEDIVAVDDGGWDALDCVEWPTTTRVLVWDDESASQNDRGEHAVASIRATAR